MVGSGLDIVMAPYRRLPESFGEIISVSALGFGDHSNTLQLGHSADYFYCRYLGFMIQGMHFHMSNTFLGAIRMNNT